MRRTVLPIALAMGAAASSAADLQNWFGDPFFQLTAGLPGCPEPAGPRVTAAERLAQSHRRAEKGTTCWLAREDDCERASAFHYDRDIAASIASAVQSGDRFGDTSLWVTVQGRVVYVEGCVSRDEQAAEIEQLIRPLPHVQQALAIVGVGTGGSAPYRRFEIRQPSGGAGTGGIIPAAQPGPSSP